MGLSFISFLGVSEYRSVQYRAGDWVSNSTPYIQVAIASLYHEVLDSPGASICILLTEKARKRHWEALQAALALVCPAAAIKMVLIPELGGEGDLWSIFDILFAQVPEQGNLLLDITHGYRSMPLLASIVVDYARTLKRIEVDGIHYAAVEAAEDGVVPIVDLTRMDRLFRWTRATELYVRRGDASGMEGLVGEQAKELFRTEGSNAPIAAEKRLVACLKESFDILNTVRGREIVAGTTFLAAGSVLKELQKESALARPMIPLYGLILTRVKGFMPGNVGNLLLAVDLCRKFGLVQQGITLLQETIVTIMLHADRFNYEDRYLREAISCNFAFLSEVGPHKLDDPFTNPKKIDPGIARVLKENPLFGAFKDIFENLRGVRNNINHAEFSQQTTLPSTFSKTLNKTFMGTLNLLSTDRMYKSVCTYLLKDGGEE